MSEPSRPLDPTVPLAPAPGSDRTLDPSSPEPAPAPDLPPGTPERAGRLALLAELGTGGMGVVFRGHDPALNRDLAVKVLLDRHKDRPDMVRRFLEEAQVCSQLQHPAIVPVHDLGTLPDGRPFFSMKLVKGRTLADWLADSDGLARERPRLLQAFGQVCQALAYAHSKRVIHRDLKPSNVMVGAFGEVQVMDWGLAKVLASGGPPPPDEAEPAAASSTVRTVRSAGACDGSQTGTAAGTALGTPAYMAPEQALGEPERIDERADVFGLGAILCELLTGRPPYTGEDTAAVFRKAVRADLADAFDRLDGSWADAELLALAKACLAAEPAARPRDAGAVAEAVAAYQAGVQERLRRAEVERAAAEARARAERRARRRALLPASALLVLLVGAAGAWYAQQRAALRREATRELDEAFREMGEGRLSEARAAAGRAGAVLGRGGPADLKARLEEATGWLHVAAKLDTYRQERWSVVGGKFNTAAAVPRYAGWFRSRGLAVGKADATEVAARVRASPIRGPLLDALDDWWALDHRGGAAVLEVLRRADPEGVRARVREGVAAGDAEGLGVLAAFIDVAELSPAALVVLAEALPREEAVALLRRAAAAHRADFWCHFQLANKLDRKRPEEEAEAAGHYRAALAARPDSAMALNNLGVLLRERKDLAGAERAYREAIRSDPNHAPVHFNLGVVLYERKDLAGAERAFREAIRSDPNDAKAHAILGVLLRERKDLAGAEQAYRAAIRSDPNDAKAHAILGLVLKGQGRFREALASLRRGHELGSRQPGWSHPSGRWVREAERLAELDERLPTILAGAAVPATAAEAAEFARLCQNPARRHYAAAARLFADAFAADPTLAAGADRYSAACAAALAAAGRDAAGPLPNKLAQRLRGQALRWLRADLAAQARLLKANPSAARAVEEQMRHWQTDADLAGVRDPAALAILPDAERREWQQLWADVADLRTRAAPEPLPPPRPAPDGLR